MGGADVAFRWRSIPRSSPSTLGSTSKDHTDMKAHIFKVSLFHAKRIYRQIACLGSQSLDGLHQAIFSAFDRYDEHLYSFYFPSKPTKSIGVIRQSLQYSHPMALDGVTYYEQQNATGISIESLDLVVKQKFYYLFDYGDNGGTKLLMKASKTVKRTIIHQFS